MKPEKKMSEIILTKPMLKAAIKAAREWPVEGCCSFSWQAGGFP